MLAIGILFLSKISSGERARWAERQFYVALMVMTFVTLRTVALSGDLWLVHTGTLGIMIIGSLMVRTQGTPLAMQPRFHL
ncbi:hypothetical protein Pla52o_56310 [Novipirellula galeiformis]|uniref:Uncharacterized protein n=2 Tax=Novipirellula galeiformis TaxID=2528004 RepID=A0A5C6BGA2_9BACT|nr:hypothetical protein Pla52o_56310 [Novipirellula galeiformis]